MINQLAARAMSSWEDPGEQTPGGESSRDRVSPAASGDKAPARRILVVEDDYFVALMIEDTLLGAGYSVLGPVGTGEEALELATEQRPDLVLMDVRLASAVDGVDAAIGIARVGIRSIFITAHSDPETKRRGQEASPHGWIEKPFSGTELLDAIRAVLP